MTLDNHYLHGRQSELVAATIAGLVQRIRAAIGHDVARARHTVT